MFSNKHRYKKFSKIKLRKSLYFMKRLRMLEEKISREYHPENKMRCPVHDCICSFKFVIKKKGLSIFTS